MKAARISRQTSKRSKAAAGALAGLLAVSWAASAVAVAPEGGFADLVEKV